MKAEATKAIVNQLGLVGNYAIRKEPSSVIVESQGPTGEACSISLRLSLSPTKETPNVALWSYCSVEQQLTKNFSYPVDPQQRIAPILAEKGAAVLYAFDIQPKIMTLEQKKEGEALREIVNKEKDLAGGLGPDFHLDITWDDVPACVITGACELDKPEGKN